LGQSRTKETNLVSFVQAVSGIGQKSGMVRERRENKKKPASRRWRRHDKAKKKKELFFAWKKDGRFLSVSNAIPDMSEEWRPKEPVALRKTEYADYGD